MKSTSNWTNYEERLGRVTAYVYDHLDDQLDLNKLAEVACLTPGARSIGVYQDDPSAVAEEELRSKACVLVDERFAIEPPVVDADITCGDYAVLRHVGPYASMKAAYQWLFGDWLVQSGREAADAPVFEEYLNSPRDTAPADLVTEIYLPLRQA